MIYGFGTVLVLAVTFYALLDAVLTDAGGVRHLPKPAWIAIIVLLPLIGPLVWLALGRDRGLGRLGRPQPQGSAQSPAGPGDRSPSGRPTATRRTNGGPTRSVGHRPTSGPPKGPEDDPEFLRRLDEQLRRRGDDS